MPQSKFTEVQGLRMHYLEWGEPGAPDILLVHGWTGLGQGWSAVAESLQDRYHVIAPERWRRGIGRMLTHTAIDWARDRGFKAIIVETAPQQEAAVALYESMDFRKRGTSVVGEYELIWFKLRV